MNFHRKDIDFMSQGVRCSAWLYLPEVSGKCPVIVMAHGLGGVREMRLDAYAEVFAMAGFACFLFDYRNFGASDGNQRQLIQVKAQLADWTSAIDFVKTLDTVDSSRLFVFGSSFSGGHVLTLSATRTDITAAVAQCPYTDTLATMRILSPLSALKVTPLAIWDWLTALVGYHPTMIALGDKPGKVALMAVPDYETFLRLVPDQFYFINEAPVRTMFEFLTYSPGRFAKSIKNPVFYGICQADTLAPAKKTLQLAKKSRLATIKEYSCGHFDIYLDDFFEQAVVDYLTFYKNHLN